MADYPHLDNWQGWLAKQKYANLDPFERPIPAPVAGIFDNTGGDLRTVCFNPAWSPILTGALSRLTVPELYLSGGEEAVQDVLKLMNNVAGIGDNPCLPQSIQATECAYYPSWYAGIEYIPYNPFTGGDLPANYAIAPFFRFAQIDTWFPDWIDDIFTGIIENTTGYLENDIFVSFLSLPTYQNPFDGLDYPTIKLTVQGTGILRLKFLLVPFGGRALISFDPVGIFDILQATWSSDDRIIELNRDILALVPETDVDAIEEIILDEDTTHEIYITFLPTINDEAPIFQYGGGFRGYELCGNLTVIDPTSGLPIDFQNQQSGIYQEGVIVATEQDLYNALVRFRTEESNRWLFASDPNNIVSGVEIDPDTGEITVKMTAIDTAPVVDATNLERANGGAYFQALKFAKLFDDMNSRISDQFAVETVQSLVSLFLNPLETVALDVLVNTYFLANPTQTINVSVLAESIYCEGDIYSGVKEYALTLTDETILNRLVDFVREVPVQTASKWFDEGSSIPRSDYLGYACTLRETLEFTIDTVTTSQTNVPVTGWSFSSPRLVRVTVSGRIIRTSTGEIIDGKNRLNSSGVIQGSAWSVFTINAGTTSLYAPGEFSPNENGDGAYSVSVVNGNSTFAFKHAINWTGDFTGSLTVKIEDLGAE